VQKNFKNFLDRTKCNKKKTQENPKKNPRKTLKAPEVPEPQELPQDPLKDSRNAEYFRSQ
jgi:hypothetical protein